jgi:hypothetical protein
MAIFFVLLHFFSHAENATDNEIGDQENAVGKRRRFRDVSRHKRHIQKTRVEKGLVHISKSGKTIPQKTIRTN